MKKFICTVCGYVYEGEEAPEFCPQCKVPRSKFKELVETEGALTFADEHVIGVAKGVDAEVLEGLKAHFTGECTEVGMYLETVILKKFLRSLTFQYSENFQLIQN